MKKYFYLALLPIFFISCDKTKVKDSTAQFMVVHASPETPDMELFIDDKPIILYPLEFTNNIYYRDILSGIRKLKVVVSGNPVIDTSLDFVQGKSYTIFVYDAPIQVKIKMIEDKLASSSAGNCRMRFFQLVPDADSLDLVNQIDNTVIASNVDFGNYQDWQLLPEGIYKWRLRRTVDGVSVYDDWRNDTLLAGKVYTMFSKGFINTQTSDSVGVWIISNGDF